MGDRRTVSRYVAVVIVDRAEGEDHPADWDWSGLLDCRTEVVMTETVPEAGEGSVRVAVDDSAVWLEVQPDGEVAW